MTADQAMQVVRDLAAADPVFVVDAWVDEEGYAAAQTRRADEQDMGRCGLCLARTPRQSTLHHETWCPWRRAREATP